jgi:cyclophilin family peptidyl-prolyl cis-trans isomerase
MRAGMIQAAMADMKGKAHARRRFHRKQEQSTICSNTHHSTHWQLNSATSQFFINVQDACGKPSERRQLARRKRLRVHARWSR